MSRKCWLPPLGYLLLSLVATWPLITHLRGWVPGFGDWGQNIWALWWTRQAILVEGHAPFFTRYLFYPEGVTLLFHPLDVSDGLLALPLYSWLGGDVSYNLLILLSFGLGGWGTYLLALSLTGRRGAAFVAGLIFALSPYHFLRIHLGHLNLSTLQWIPFYGLFLLRFLRSGARRDGGLAIFFLLFNALNSWYYVLYCGLLSVGLLFWPGRGTAFRGRLRRTGLVLGLALVGLSPLVWPMLRLMGETVLVGEHNPLRHSVDLLSFWIPGPPSTWAAWFEDVWISYAAHNREPGASAYLGYTVLALSLVGLIGHRKRREVLWWLGMGLGFGLLALGPRLQIDGRILAISLPYGWLSRISPIFAIAGIPGRFVVMVSLALAMMAAYGLSWLTALPAWAESPPSIPPSGGEARLSSPRRGELEGGETGLSSPRRGELEGGKRNRRTAILWLCGLLIGLEYLAVPLHLSPTELNPFYDQLAADPRPYAILDVKWDANFLLHAQTKHRKPLIGGWLARLPAEQAAYLDQAGLDQTLLYLLLGPQPVADQPAAIQAALTERRVRYLIDHDQMARPLVEQLIHWPVVYEQGAVTVYENAALP